MWGLRDLRRSNNPPRTDVLLATFRLTIDKDEDVNKLTSLLGTKLVPNVLCDTGAIFIGKIYSFLTFHLF